MISRLPVSRSCSRSENDNAEGVKGYYDWWKPLQARGMPGFERLPKHVVIPQLNNIDRMERIRAGARAQRFQAVAGGEDHGWQLDAGPDRRAGLKRRPRWPCASYC